MSNKLPDIVATFPSPRGVFRAATMTTSTGLTLHRRPKNASSVVLVFRRGESPRAKVWVESIEGQEGLPAAFSATLNEVKLRFVKHAATPHLYQVGNLSAKNAAAIQRGIVEKALTQQVAVSPRAEEVSDDVPPEPFLDVCIETTFREPTQAGIPWPGESDDLPIWMGRGGTITVSPPLCGTSYGPSIELRVDDEHAAGYIVANQIYIFRVNGIWVSFAPVVESGSGGVGEFRGLLMGRADPHDIDAIRGYQGGVLDNEPMLPRTRGAINRLVREGKISHGVHGHLWRKIKEWRQSIEQACVARGGYDLAAYRHEKEVGRKAWAERVLRGAYKQRTHTYADATFDEWTQENGAVPGRLVGIVKQFRAAEASCAMYSAQQETYARAMADAREDIVEAEQALSTFEREHPDLVRDTAPTGM